MPWKPDRRVLAATIANARIMRHGHPGITNILDMLPEHLLEGVLYDADAVLRLLESEPDAATPSAAYPRPPHIPRKSG